MDLAPRTHRDTFALVLAIGGASAWALFPAIALLRDTSDGSELILAVALVAGCVLGAFSAATTLPGVSLATAGVAGGVAAALGIGSIDYIEFHRTPAIGLATAGTVVGAAIAAAAGAAGGRAAARPWPALVAAWIVIAAAGGAGLVSGILIAAGVDLTGGEVTAIVLLAPVPGCAVAAWLCRGARPRSVAAWLFVLSFATFGVIAIADHDKKDVGEMLLGGAFIAAIAAGGGALITSVVRRIQRPPVTTSLPSAQIVER